MMPSPYVKDGFLMRAAGVRVILKEKLLTVRSYGFFQITIFPPKKICDQ
jgi:hypothetical protein